MLDTDEENERNRAEKAHRLKWLVLKVLSPNRNIATTHAQTHEV